MKFNEKDCPNCRFMFDAARVIAALAPAFEKNDKFLPEILEDLRKGPDNCKEDSIFLEYCVAIATILDIEVSEYIIALAGFSLERIMDALNAQDLAQYEFEVA